MDSASEYHPNPAPKRDNVCFRREDIFAVKLNGTGDSGRCDKVVHSVQTAQVAALAAAGRSDKSCDRFASDVKRDVF